MDDVQGLRVFAAVAEQLSFTKAAETLFLTQSAVSHRIAKLEQELAAPLLRREGRRISLTPAGAALLEQARRIFAVLDDATAAVKRVARPEAGHLRIGASAAACQWLLPDALREFRECFPDFTLSITPGDAPIVAERVADGAADLGLLVRPESKRARGKLAYDRLFADELGAVLSPLHPWAKAGRVEPAELSAQRWILYARGSVTHRMIERHFLKFDAAVTGAMELGSIDAAKELIKLGLGVGVMARWVVRPELAEGSLAHLRLPGPRLRRTWCVARAEGRELSIAEQTFIGLCREAAAALAGA